MGRAGLPGVPVRQQSTIHIRSFDLTLGDLLFEIGETGLRSRVAQLTCDGVHLRVQRDDLILRRHRLPDVADVLRDGSKAFLNNGGKE